MKCDELKVYVPQVGPYGLEPEEGGALVEEKTCYLKSKVDEAIAELKAKLDEKDEDIAYWRKEYDEETKLTDALKAEIESLKASHYAEMVDAGMRERRLRRALWRAIALFCARSCEYFSGIMNHCLMGQDDIYRRCEEKKNKYLNAMYKCRAKMEQYKEAK